MKEKIYSIGIDVSKKTLDICFLRDKFKVLKEFKIENSTKGIHDMLKKMQKYKVDKSMSLVLEATGSYHVLAALLLKNEGYSVKVFNPIISNKYSRNSVRKCKTDKIDARRIAEIGVLENFPELELTKEMFFFRKKISLLKTLTKQLQVMKASLNQFLEDCDVLNEKPNAFFASAQATLSHLKKTINKIEKEIQDYGKTLPGFELISEIKGVSEKATSIILSYISDKKFKSKYAITAFAGLDVSTKQSGTSINGRGRISKRGNNMLRNALAQASWGLMMHNEAFQKLAKYYRAKGKHYFEIMMILARKLIHIIYGMLKNNSHFDPVKIIIPKSL